MALDQRTHRLYTVTSPASDTFSLLVLDRR
jgi:hypothetical protein